MELYLHFILDMARSPGFGSMATDSIRALNTRFRFASGTQYLKLASYYNSPDRSTKSTTPPFNGLCLLVSTRFQVLFHSPPGVLFTFPSRYCSTIGHQVVFRLGGWSPRLPTGFLVSRGTLDPASCLWISCTGFSPSVIGLPRPFHYPKAHILQSVTPERTRSGLGSFHFARRYFGNRVFFLFLALLRCFSSGGSPPYVMDWRMDD